MKTEIPSGQSAGEVRVQVVFTEEEWKAIRNMHSDGLTPMLVVQVADTFHRSPAMRMKARADVCETMVFF